MKKIYLSYLCFLLFFGCKNASHSKMDSEDKMLPVIDIEKALDNLCNEPLNFSEFISDIEYVPLETNKNGLIGNEIGINYLMTDKHIIYGELMFNADGSFVRKMGSKGQGPGEYRKALKVAVDEQLEEFYVLTNYNRRIMTYDLNNNRFKHSVPARSLNNDIISMGNHLMFVCEEKSGSYRDLTFFDYCIINSENGDTLRIKQSESCKKYCAITTKHLQYL